MEEYVSRWMLVRHSQLVVSGWPVPMYFAWRRSSSCWVRSLSAWQGLAIETRAERGSVVPFLRDWMCYEGVRGDVQGVDGDVNAMRRLGVD